MIRNKSKNERKHENFYQFQLFHNLNHSQLFVDVPLQRCWRSIIPAHTDVRFQFHFLPIFFRNGNAWNVQRKSLSTILLIRLVVSDIVGDIELLRYVERLTSRTASKIDFKWFEIGRILTAILQYALLLLFQIGLHRLCLRHRDEESTFRLRSKRFPLRCF